MKIVQIIARVNQGGTARWLDLLIPELQKLGHEVKLLAGEVAENENEDPCFDVHNGIRIKGLGRSISPLQDLKSIFTIRKYLKDFKPDLVNTHTAKAGLIGRLACLGLNVKVVHTYHGHLLYGYFSPVKTQILILIEKILAKTTDSFIAVGDQVREDLISVGIGKASQYSVIHPAIKKLNFERKNSARKKLGISGSAFTVGWLGRLTKIKRPDRVLELAMKFPEVIFLIGGTGEEAIDLKSKAPTNVKFLGWIEPETFWPACDVALLTSDNEGLPTSLIEAAFAAIPIISENVGSAKEIFEDGIGGHLVKGAIERTNAIRILLENRELLLEIGQSAKDYVEKNFGVSLFISKHLHLYGLFKF